MDHLEKLLYSRKEASKLFGISPKTLTNLVKQKQLLVIYIGDRPMFTKEDLLKFINNQRKVG